MANWVYRRPFDYRGGAYRSWIMPSPKLTIEVTDTVTVAENIIFGSRLTMSVSESLTVADSIVILLPFLAIAKSESLSIAEFADANAGVISISKTETIAVAEGLVVQPRSEAEVGNLLTLKVGM